VTIADGLPIDMAELIRGMIENAGLGQLLPRLGPDGGPLRRLLEYQFELVAALVLETLEAAYGARLEVPSIPYSRLGGVDITGYRESYAGSVRGGDEIVIVNPEQGVYAPSQPFRDGQVELVLTTKPGYFNDAGVEGVQVITVGDPEEADEPFVITRIEAPPVPWNDQGEVEIHWTGEGITFPVEIDVRVADCSGFTECDLGGGEFKRRANPLIYPIECTSNRPNPTPQRVRIEIRLEDREGKSAGPEQVVLQCGLDGEAARTVLAEPGRATIRGGLAD
jgi:hypothetical protein